MNELTVVSIAFGLLIIATRGPLIFAPEGTRRVYQSVIETPSRIRGLACAIGLLGLGALAGTTGTEGTLSTVMEVIGWWLVGGGVLLLLFPAGYQRLARSFMDAFDSTALRAVGFLGVGVGALFIYFGAAAG